MQKNGEKMVISELLTTYQDLGYGGVLLTIIFFVGRYLINQNKACFEKYEAHINKSQAEIRELTEKMFQVVQHNTTATNSLRQTMADIYSKGR